MKKGEDFTGICVVFYCHDGNGNYLFEKRGKNSRGEKGFWNPGSGGLKFGEKATDALYREIQEEYGAKIFEYEFLGYRDIYLKNGSKKNHWLALDFRVHVDPKTVKNNEPKSIEEIAWHRLDDLPFPMYPYEASCKKSYPDKLV